MIISYSNADIYISNAAIHSNIKRLINQIYKLLPLCEEGGDWVKPLETIIVELSGMDSLLFDQNELFFSLLCKLRGLIDLDGVEDFQLFRRTIFECLSLLTKINESFK